MKDERTKIYFLHIHKTAGSSLAGLIRRAYGPGQGVPAHNFPDLTRLSREAINSYRCYTGHFGTGLFSLLDAPIPTVTILRDPFERTLSQLRHAERMSGKKFFFSPLDALADWKNALRGEARHPLEKLLRPPFGPMMAENFQTRTLGVNLDFRLSLGKGDRRDFMRVLDAERGREDDATILENAKRRLDGMAVVGTVERFEESVGLICERLGIPVPDKPPTDNVAQGRIVGQSYRDTDALPRRINERIEEMTALDRQLYHYANRLLDENLARRAGKSPMRLEHVPYVAATP